MATCAPNISAFDCEKPNRCDRLRRVQRAAALLRRRFRDRISRYGSRSARRAELADELVETYAEISGDEDLGVFVPFYKCYRACVRGKVESLRSLEREVGDAEASERARQLASSYFELASRYAACDLRPDHRMRAFGFRQIDRRASSSTSQRFQSDQLGSRPQAAGSGRPLMSTPSPTMARTSIPTGLRKSPTTRCWPRRNASCRRLRSNSRRHVQGVCRPSIGTLARDPARRSCALRRMSLSVKKKRYADWNVADRHKVKCQTPRQRCTECSARSSSRFARFRLETICASIPLESANAWSPRSRTHSSA